MIELRFLRKAAVRIGLLSLALPVVLASSVVSLPAQGQESDVDHPGSDYARVVLNASICEALCTNDAKCKVWSYIRANAGAGPDAVCWLKSAV